MAWTSHTAHMGSSRPPAHERVVVARGAAALLRHCIAVAACNGGGADGRHRLWAAPQGSGAGPIGRGVSMAGTLRRPRWDLNAPRDGGGSRGARARAARRAGAAAGAATPLRASSRPPRRRAWARPCPSGGHGGAAAPVACARAGSVLRRIADRPAFPHRLTDRLSGAVEEVRQAGYGVRQAGRVGTGRLRSVRARNVV
eukprot:366138-Chlamydomonas_euryale.AAC.4